MNRHYIKNCVDRRFTWDGKAFVWSHPTYKFEIVVTPTQTQTGSDIVTVTITDKATNALIKKWSHDIQCGEGDWRDRLQALTGKLLIKAQHRPFCPNCQIPLQVKTTKKGDRQFFGCPNYRGPSKGCHHTKDISKAFETDTEVHLRSNDRKKTNVSPARPTLTPPQPESRASADAP